MTTDRRTMLTLLALDIVVSVVVFNIVGGYRGISPHLILTPLVAPVAVFFAAVYLIDGYNIRTDMLGADYAGLHAIATLSAMVATILLTFAVFPEGYELHSSRGVIAVSFLILIPLTIGYRRLLYLQAASTKSASSIIFVGDNAACLHFREECFKMSLQRPVIHCLPPGSDTHPPVDGGEALHRPLAEVLSEIREGRLSAEAIVLRHGGTGLPQEMTQELVRLFFRGVPTYTLELFHQVFWHKIPLHRLDPSWLFEDGFRITREPVFERLKRISDVLLSGFGLLLAIPVFIVAIPAIWLEDRGPVFFMQTRVGRNRAPFRLAKLRTMRVQSETGDLYTQPGDARITRVGRLLRLSRLDEVPQLWNVLKGDMSLIGPRAEWDRLVDEYEQKIPCYYFRHLVKPGITGWAQVNYLYGANLEDTVRKLEYDLYYIRYYSIRLDASIVLKTINVMLFGKGR